jgi:DNA modification methylase
MTVHCPEQLRPLLTPIGDVHPAPHNPRTGHAVDGIARSLRELGWHAPLVAREDGELIVGHGRLAAALQLGEKQAPVLYLDDDRGTAVARMVADNRLTELSDWDVEGLQGLVDESLAVDVDDELAALSGWIDDLDLDEVLGEVESPTPPKDPGPQIDMAEELRKKWGVEGGQIWALGEHRVLCGDIFDTDAVRSLGIDDVTFVLTDPPYGMSLDTDWSGIKGSLRLIGGKRGTRGKKYDPVIGDDQPFDPTIIFGRFGACREMFLFGADYYAENIPDRTKGSWIVWDKRKKSQADAIGAEFELCWSKAKHKRRVLRHDWFGFLSSGNGSDARNRVHPTQKPVSLLVDILEQWSKSESVVADPYLGSGSTLIACEQLNRRCRAIEIDPGYVAVALQRWADMTGKTPKLL